MQIIGTPPIPIGGTPSAGFISDTENPPGCEKPKAYELVRGPFSDCNVATVQVYATGGSGAPYQYSWNGGTTFGADSTRTIFGAQPSNAVVVQDGAGQIAYAFYEIKPYPPLKILFDKINGCGGGTGEIRINRLLNGFLLKNYLYAVTQSYNAVTNTVLNDTPVTNGTFNNGIQLTIPNLTLGNYRLRITDPDTLCEWSVRFSICDNCGDSSSDYPDQNGGCPCNDCDDCTDDTHVNINLGN